MNQPLINKNKQMSTKGSPIVAKVVFYDCIHPFFFAGDLYEKENIKVMIYNLRNMLLEWIEKEKIHKIEIIKSIQMYNNTLTGDRLILEYKYGQTLRNELPYYLGNDYNPPKLQR